MLKDSWVSLAEDALASMNEGHDFLHRHKHRALELRRVSGRIEYAKLVVSSSPLLMQLLLAFIEGEVGWSGAAQWIAASTATVGGVYAFWRRGNDPAKHDVAHLLAKDFYRQVALIAREIEEAHENGGCTDHLRSEIRTRHDKLKDVFKESRKDAPLAPTLALDVKREPQELVYYRLSALLPKGSQIVLANHSKDIAAVQLLTKAPAPMPERLSTSRTPE